MNMIFSIIEPFSRKAMIYGLDNKKVQILFQKLEFCMYNGYPQEFCSDNGREFKNS